MDLHAVICVPSTETDRWEAQCLAYCMAMGYEIAAVVTGVDTDPGAWMSANAMIAAGEAQIIIVALYEHLPADRIPRTEVAAGPPIEVAEVMETGPALPRQRRPRLIRGGQAGLYR